MSTQTTNWQDEIAAPSKRNLSRIGVKTFEEFLENGKTFKDRICWIIEKNKINLSGTNILDFGCGCGRFFLPMHFETDANVYGTDIDHTAIYYLSFVTKSNNLSVNKFSPPLDYPNGFFDIIVSISIWTHLTPEDGMKWLREVKRILKPGGLALISTGGLATLKSRRDRSQCHWLKKWKDVMNEDLARQRIIYKEYDGLRKNANFFVGVEGSYGLTVYHPDQIMSEWKALFESIEILESYIARQDLIILKKSGCP